MFLGRCRIVKQLSKDDPPKYYYVIQEIVTTQGHYIQWNGIFSTLSQAGKEIANIATDES